MSAAEFGRRLWQALQDIGRPMIVLPRWVCRLIDRIERRTTRDRR